MITRKELIQEYLNFFKSKGHKVIPNVSLVPKDDPTTLFISAGMQPLVPYLLGKKHPSGKRLVGIQKCIRTTDIDEVGDSTHHTFFEMLGNWSLGDYWKKEAIEMSFEFLTKVLGIKSKDLSVTCFAGENNIPQDTESENIWKSLGVKKIKFLGMKDNWWGPAGNTGPCGPDTEMFVKGVEIWNDVFIQYNCKFRSFVETINGRIKDKMELVGLEHKSVDTGMGVERTLAVLNRIKDNYMTETFLPIIKQIEKLSGKKYKGNEKAMRIIADHVKTSVFIIADGIEPSNTQQGYVLRRLIRRAIVHGKKLGIKIFTPKVAESVLDIYKKDYMEIKNKKEILRTLSEEEEKFNKTLERGLGVFNKLTKDKSLSFRDAFLLYQSYGFPIELTQELAKEKKIEIDISGFEKELKKHQGLSRLVSSGVFKSGLADHSGKTVRLHTATHLLNEALRCILGKKVRQRGSNITPERLRFDFNFPRKLTPKEIEKVEDLVNDQIRKGLNVTSGEMPLKQALKSGAQSEFGAKYPKKVSVYTIGNFSKEICTGPHVTNTAEIGKFRITKEESSAAGVRRIKAVVE